MSPCAIPSSACADGTGRAALDRVQAKLEQGFATIRVLCRQRARRRRGVPGGFADRFAGRVRIESLDFSNLVGWRDALRLTERYAAIAEVMLVETSPCRGDLEGFGNTASEAGCRCPNMSTGTPRVGAAAPRLCRHPQHLAVRAWRPAGDDAHGRDGRSSGHGRADRHDARAEPGHGSRRPSRGGSCRPCRIPPTMPALGCTSMTSSQAGSNTSMATSVCRNDRASARWSSRATGHAVFGRPFHVQTRPDRSAGPHDRSIEMLLDFIECQVGAGHGPFGHGERDARSSSWAAQVVASPLRGNPRADRWHPLARGSASLVASIIHGEPGACPRRSTCRRPASVRPGRRPRPPGRPDGAVRGGRSTAMVGRDRGQSGSIQAGVTALVGSSAATSRSSHRCRDIPTTRAMIDGPSVLYDTSA